MNNEIFSYRLNNENKMFIYWYDVQLKILSGQNAEKLLQKIENASPEELQLILAKATGNIKRKKDETSNTIVIRGVHHTRSKI